MTLLAAAPGPSFGWRLDDADKKVGTTGRGVHRFEFPPPSPSPIPENVTDGNQDGNDTDARQRLQDEEATRTQRKKKQSRTLEILEREFRLERSKHVVGLLKQALNLLDRQSFDADPGTFATLLKGCSDAQALAAGRFVHQHIVRSGQEADRFLCNCLIEMYGKCGSVDEARSVFDCLEHPNVFSCTIMISAYALNNHHKRALLLYERMRLDGVIPNKFTISTILSSCLNSSFLQQGVNIHADAIKHGVESDAVIGTSLVNMYGRCGRVRDASIAFNNIHNHDVISWNAIIAVHVQHGHSREALLLFYQMEQKGVEADKITFVSVLGACNCLDLLAQGKLVHAMISESGVASDIVLENALIDMYGKCGSAMDAWSIFNQMHYRDVVSWTSMISAHAQHGRPQDAIELYGQMQGKGLKPNEFTFMGILSACANLAALTQGQEIHNTIIQTGFGSDVLLGTALINMYGKCRTWLDARSVFDHLHGRDVVSWNTILVVCAQLGYGKEAFQLLQQMKHECKEPDEITFTSVLTACSRAGMVEEACCVYESISKDYGLTPTMEHCGCMIDLLGWAGLLKEAENFIVNMPMKPNAAAWESFLYACRQHENMLHATKGVLELDSSDAGPYMQLSTMYVSNGRWSNVGKWMATVI